MWHVDETGRTVRDEGMMAGSHTRAEAGDGGQPFQAILEELDRVRKESEATNLQLQRRNRELAAVSAVSQATSTRILDLAGTLERALEVVLEITGLSAGWILLLPQVGSEPVLSSSAGLTQDIVEGLAGFRPPDCECAKVLVSRQPMVVHPLHTDCPIRRLELRNGRPVTCHATVPLLTRSEALGVLNLASDDLVSFDEQELALLGAIGRQLGLAVENARLWEGLKQRDQLRRQFVEQALAAQEEERKRIARELHDQIGQALTSLLLTLRALEDEADRSEEPSVSSVRLQEVKAIVADTLDGVRDLALGLRPSVLDDLGLVPALRRVVRTFNTRHALAIDFQPVRLEGVRLPPAVETALYRIVQEALTNVVQHASASRVSLLLEARADTVTLIVEDDGLGFQVDSLMHGAADKRWLGLYGMRERAELLGGMLTVESAPGAGTTVFVRVPLHNERGGQAE
jgi:signal transduction histidine kinase